MDSHTTNNLTSKASQPVVTASLLSEPKIRAFVAEDVSKANIYIIELC